jgi:hypothetical protein
MPFCAAQIVYSNSWINQSGNISPTTLVTSQSNGIYRVSAWLIGFPGGSITLGNGTDNFNLSNTLLDNSNAGKWLGDGSSISLSASPSNGNPYSVFVVIEQLA